MKRLDDIAYTALRVVSGVLFAFHGLPKLFGIYGKQVAFSANPQLWFGGLIELVCGVLIALGAFSRIAAFLASGTMAVAFFQFHAAPAGSILPIVNKGELAALYCFLFLMFAARGPGPWAVNRR